MTRRPQPRALAARRRRRTLTRLSLRHTRVTRNTPPSSSTYSRLASVSFSLFAMSRSAVCSRTQRRSVPSPLGSRSLLPHHAFACTTARTDQDQGREPGARPVHAPRREEVGEALSHRPQCPLARSHCRRRDGRPRREDVTYMTADRARLPASRPARDGTVFVPPMQRSAVARIACSLPTSVRHFHWTCPPTRPLLQSSRCTSHTRPSRGTHTHTPCKIPIPPIPC